MANELGNALIDSATADNLKDIAVDALELGADALTDNEALKAIPVFGTLLKLLKGIMSLRDYQFTKVLIRFLQAYSKVSDEKRTEFLIRMEDEPEFKRKVGEQLIFILNRVDDIYKAEVLGNLFKSYVENKYDSQTLTRLCAIVNNSFLPDVIGFSQRMMQVVYKPHDLLQLANAGFLDSSLRQVITSGETLEKRYGVREKDKGKRKDENKVIMHYPLNSYGALILWYGLNVRNNLIHIALDGFAETAEEPE